MHPRDQQIAIARACGLPEPYTLWKEHGKTALAHSVRVEDGMKCAKRVPDYLNDLNAMHEAESTLSPEQVADYVFELHMRTPGADLTAYEGRMSKAAPYFFPVIHATAAQRAEAFLRTLNLWQEDEP